MLTNDSPEVQPLNFTPKNLKSRKPSASNPKKSEDKLAGLLSRPASKKNSRLTPSKKKPKRSLDFEDPESDEIQETKKIPNITSNNFLPGFLEDTKSHPYKSSISGKRGRGSDKPNKRVSFYGDSPISGNTFPTAKNFNINPFIRTGICQFSILTQDKSV